MDVFCTYILIIDFKILIRLNKTENIFELKILFIWWATIYMGLVLSRILIFVSHLNIFLRAINFFEFIIHRINRNDNIWLTYQVNHLIIFRHSFAITINENCSFKIVNEFSLLILGHQIDRTLVLLVWGFELFEFRF